ncbi:MAG: hypothetical protein V1704_04695 [Candidatus Vogelbacteria bacterium]
MKNRIWDVPRSLKPAGCFRKEREMGSTLSQVLLEHQFMPVYGTTEKVDGKLMLVSTGMPFTWDANNGISVVYDENGRPWIKRGNLPSPWSSDCPTIIPGAYVPHSNDGGWFENEFLGQVEKTDKKVDEVLREAVLMLAVEKLFRRVANDNLADVSSIHKLRIDVAKLYEQAKLVHRAKTHEELSSATEELKSV